MYGDGSVNPGDDNSALVQKGESDPIVGHIRELLDNREWRTIFYTSLISLAIFPIFVDAVDLFNQDGTDKYTGNEFCNAEMECSMALAGMILYRYLSDKLYTLYTGETL